MNLSNLSKQILTALAGATVSLGTTFSLLLPSAQAANFTTTFTDGSDSSKWVQLFWSGEDQQLEGEEGYGLLSSEELLGGIRIEDSYGNSSVFELSALEYVSVNFDLSTLKFDLDQDYALDLSRDMGGDRGFLGMWNWWDGGGESVLVFDYIEGDGVDTELKWVRQLTTASTPEPSLTLGFITLGGLVLGGTIKNRKAKSQEI